MRQSYFFSIVLLWFIGTYFSEKIQPDCGPRLYVNASAASGGDGTSWATAFNKLQDAISLANSCVGISEIWVAQGTYYPDEGTGITDNNRSQSFNLKSGLAIYGGFVGNETELDQRDWSPTILSGEIGASNTIDDNSYHVVRGISVNNTAILDGFTITAGNANGGPGNDDGGGIYNNNATSQIRNCSLSGNRASDSGGGMANITASPIVINCSFSANTVAGFGGGGAFANLFDSSPTFTGCSFSNNSATNGGAGYNVNASQTFINCSFSGNAASANGGAMYNASCTPNFINCIFSINLAAKKGAGMYNSNADFTIINCSFRGNSSVENGGGIYNFNSSDPVLTNCILWGNINGEIVNDGGSTATVTYSIVKGGHSGAGNLDIDPLFVNAGGNDLRLQACSPAIDAGNNAVVTASTDPYDNTRILNATNDVSAFVDMGAYEFTGTASTTKYYYDADGDGYGDPNTILRSCSVPGGYITNTNDCDDANGDINPGATEICDDIDNDCDGEIDEGVKTIYYKDHDQDGLGDPNVSIEACQQPVGYVTNDDDVDDNCAGYTFTGVYPDFDQDGYGNPNASGEYTVPYCDNPMLPGLFVYNNQDCNDNNFNIKPGAVEICDELDNDCDGLVDEGFVKSFWYYDGDGDGYGDPTQPYIFNPSCNQPLGYVSNFHDCNDSQFQGNNFIVYVDEDGDGYHGYSYTVCSGFSTGSSTLGQDCNDGDNSIHAGAIEICDDKDNDCDGLIDEDCSPACTDETPPTFTGSYTDVNLGCNPANPDGSLGTATATDASGAVTITSTDGSVVTDGCSRSKTRTFTAIDACGNIATILRTVSWIEDLNAPVFTGSYANEDLGCNPADPGASLGAATATDACGSVTISSADGIIQSTGCNRTQTRTFTAKDGCGNTSTTSRAIKWTVDTKAPQFTRRLFDKTADCNLFNYQINYEFEDPEPTDACGDPTLTHVDNDEPIAGTCMKKRTRIWTATDACGNTATTRQSVTWSEDDRAPTFTGTYSEIILEANPSTEAIAAALGSATATDFCGNPIISSVDGAVQSTGCTRSQTRKFTARDACNNTSTVSRTVRWTQGGTPTFTGSYTEIGLGCNPVDPASSLGSATATDACGEVTITFTDGDVQTDGCNRTQTRTFIATNASANTASTSRTVTWVEDNTPPSFTGIYTDVNLGCNPADPSGSLGSATATDACGTVTITHLDGAVNIDELCSRSQKRTFTAKDGCGNTATISRTIRWIVDLTPPTFTGIYAGVNLGCNPSYPNGSLGTATASDACGAVTITAKDGSVVSEGCNRSISRTFTAKDGCNNTSTTSRTVRWIVDLTPPSFTGSYADVNLGCNPSNSQSSLGTATAADACGAITITHVDAPVVSSGCNRSITRNFTATDGCLNTSSTSRTVRWIHDLTAPLLSCAQTGTITRSTIEGLCAYKVDGIELDPTASDVCSNPSLAWTVTGATTINGTGSMSGVLLNFGNNTIKWTATDGCLNTSTCSFVVSVNKVTTTTTLVVSTTPTSNPVTQQYSDKITCVATVTPANCPGAGPIGGTVTFKIITAEGTVVLGTAPVASDGTATLTDTLLENQFYPGTTNLLPSNGPLKPGTKTVTAIYSNTDPDYIVSNRTAPLVVSCEDAEITYNGLNYFGANPNTNQGTITVSAFVFDSNDVNDVQAQARGDIRNATVTFKEGTSAGGTIGTASIPVGLVNPTNFQEGIVTTNKTYTLSAQEISYGGKIVDVWAGVNNYYCGEVAEVVPVCISLPGGDFVTGGGWIKMLNSEGSYAGTDDKKMHAALVFKWNKSNKNLQGNATIIYKRMVNGVQKVYQIKSNSITSMIVNNVNNAGTAVTTGATYRMAQIVTKANFRDLTDPDFPITLFGNLTLTITAWESIGVTDGSQDRVSVQLVGSGSQGLIFSSNWLNGATQWQQLNSGKMRVRNPSAEIPCTNCSGSGITAKPGEVDKATEVLPEEDLKVVAMPNPSSTNFRIAIRSKDLKEPVKIIISDMLGRIIETRITYAGQITTIGEKYRSGTYAVRIIQGKKIRQMKLIKIPD